MLVLINGAFGVGKTSVAKALRQRLKGSRIFDPEPLGLALRRPAHWLRLKGRATDDFQDMPLWRKSTVAGVRFTGLLSRQTIMPMAFSNPAYLAEIVGGVVRFDQDVRQFCLTAPIEIVRERLRRRGVEPDSREGKWVYRRAAECCEAHARSGFGEPIPTEGLTIEDIADRIKRRLALETGREEP